MSPVVIGNATLYLGDCREILPTLPKVDAVVTDPVWPNCPSGLLAGADSSQHMLLANALEAITADVVVIVLGFNSDPRFLSAVPARWPFIRSQMLPYAIPGRMGRLLGGDEVAYVFGAIPKGRGLIPGRAPVEATHKAARFTGHPCPRSDNHMRWLMGHWSRETVLDPFMGTGASGVGAMQMGRPFIGIEIDPKYFDIACERVAQAQKQIRMFA